MKSTSRDAAEPAPPAGPVRRGTTGNSQSEAPGGTPPAESADTGATEGVDIQSEAPGDELPAEGVDDMPPRAKKQRQQTELDDIYDAETASYHSASDDEKAVKYLGVDDRARRQCGALPRQARPLHAPSTGVTRVVSASSRVEKTQDEGTT